MADSLASEVQTSELVLVHLDFVDGTVCKLFLPSDVAQRLQHGDESLLEALREQFTSVSSDSSNKRKDVFSEEDIENDLKRQKLEVPGTSIAGLMPECKVEEIEESFVTGQNDVAYMESDMIDTTYFQEDSVQQGDFAFAVISDQSLSATNKFTTKESKKVRKTGPKKYMKYSADDREEAVRMVRLGVMSQQEASKKYNIPQATLSDAIRTGSSECFKCDTCGRQFSLKVHFIKHMKTHTIQKPFLCDTCGFSAADKASFSKHISHKHPELYKSEDFGKHRRNSNFPKKYLWTEEATKLLFIEYENCACSYHESLESIDIWNDISEALSQKYGRKIDSKEISVKWKSLVRSYRTFKKSGESKRAFTYLTEMEDFLNKMQGKHVEFLEEEEQTPKDKTMIVWTAEMVDLLLDEYRTRFDKFVNPLIKNKTLWEEIDRVLVSNGHIVSAAQLENKWKVLVRNYKTYEGSNFLSQEKQECFPYYEQLAEILTLKENLNGEAAKLSNGEINTYLPTSIQDNPRELWPDEVIEIFINHYKALLDKVEYMYVKKASIWQGLSESLGENGIKITPCQIQNKWKLLLRSWKKFMDKEWNVSSGEEIPFSVIKVHELLESHPYLQPDYEVTIEEDPQSQGSIDDPDLFIWSSVTEKLLLNEYKKLSDKCGSLTVKKKMFWQKLCESFAAEGYVVTPNKLFNKWQVLKKGYSMACTKTRAKPFPYMEEMKELLFVNPGSKSCVDESPAEVSQVENTNELSPNWTSDIVMLFLHEYGIQKANFDMSEPKNKKKRLLWKAVSQELSLHGYEFTVAQCENKMKSLLRSYRAFKVGSLSAEGRSKYMPHLEKMAEIMGESEVFETIVGNMKETDEHSPDSQILQDMWTNETVNLLIDEYGARLDQFDKEEIDKNFLWMEIEATFAAVGYEISAADIRQKWKELVIKYKTMLTYMDPKKYSCSKKIVKKFPYFEKMEELLGIFPEGDKTRDYEFGLSDLKDKCEKESENHCAADISIASPDNSEINLLLGVGKNNAHGMETVVSVEQDSAGILLLDNDNSEDDIDSISQIVVDSQINQMITTFHNENIIENDVNSSSIKQDFSIFNVVDDKPSSSQTVKFDHETAQTSTVTNDLTDDVELNKNLNNETDQTDKSIISIKDETSKEKAELVSEVVKHLKQLETIRIRAETERLKELNQLLEGRLSGVDSMDKLMKYMDEYELKREKILKEKMEDVAMKHNEKISFLSNLLRCEKMTDEIC